MRKGLGLRLLGWICGLLAGLFFVIAVICLMAVMPYGRPESRNSDVRRKIAYARRQSMQTGATAIILGAGCLVGLHFIRRRVKSP